MGSPLPTEMIHTEIQRWIQGSSSWVTNYRITHISVSLVFAIVIATVTDKNTENDQVFAFLRWRFKPMYDFILGHLINIVPADLWRFFASSEHLIKSLVSQNLVLIFLLLGVTVARYHCQAVYFQIQAWYKSTFIAHTHIVSFSSYLIKCWLTAHVAIIRTPYQQK